MGITLLSAVLHATWNAMAHAVTDRLIGFAWIGTVYTIVCAPAALVLGFPPSSTWPYVVASAAIHVLYQLLLMTSYQLGEFSQVYPLARGTAPWVVAIIEIVVLGQHLHIVALIGVLVISVGLVSLVLHGGRLPRQQFPALGAAFATGLFIAAYTVVDAVAVSQAPVLTYAAWMFLLQGPMLPLMAFMRRKTALPSQMRPALKPGLGGGLISLAAYALVLFAQTSGATAAVAALRETSIIVGALIGTLFFGERFGYRRAVAALFVAVGVVLLSV